MLCEDEYPVRLIERTVGKYNPDDVVYIKSHKVDEITDAFTLGCYNQKAEESK